MRQRTIGTLQILLAGLCFGLLGLFGKWVFSLGLGPGEFLSLRFLVASALLGPAALTARGVPAIGRGLALRAFLLGVFGYAVFSSCYFAALRGLSVSLTVLLLYAYPVWVTLGARFFLGERPTRGQWLALPAALSGLLFLLWEELSVREPLALALGFSSSAFYAAYILASRLWLRGAPAVASSFYVMLGAGLVLGALHLRTLPVSGELWLALLATALIGTLIPIALFLAGLQKLSGTEASLLSLAEPCVGVLIGVTLFGDSFGAPQLTGALLIAVGMVLTARAKPA